MVKVGGRAPDIVLADVNGNTVHLSNFRGQKVIVYFYPKDMTPGCTIEACNFRDVHPKLRGGNVAVIGISPDPISRHAKFAEKYDLPFTLLADVDRVASEAYGVWQEKKFMGRTFMGIVRSTFLIDEKGKVSAAWRKVSVKDHAAEVASKALGVKVKLPKEPAKKKATKKKATKKKAAKKKATKKKATKKKATKKKATKKKATKKKATKKKATKKKAAKKKATKKKATKKKAAKKKATKKKATKKKAAKKKATKKKATKKKAAKKKVAKKKATKKR
jgi:thioredoxin-dependent peroxiredoxin